MQSAHMIPALAMVAASVQAIDIGGSDGSPSNDGTIFSFKSGSNGEGVDVGPKGINAWAPSATNNTCVPKGSEGLQSVVAGAPVLDLREDRIYCILGYESDNCIGQTVVGKEYQAPVVNLMDEDAPPDWIYTFETDISSAQVVSGACPMIGGTQAVSGVPASSESRNPSNAAPGEQKASATQASDSAQSSSAQAPDPQQSSNAQVTLPPMMPLLLIAVFIAGNWL